MSKQDIVLLLWAKQWIHMLPTLKARNRIPAQVWNSVWISVMLPSLFTISFFILPAYPDGFLLCYLNWVMLTAFTMLNISQSFLFSSSPTEVTNAYLCRIMLGLAVTRWLLDPTSLVYSLDKGGRLHLEKQEPAVENDFPTFKSSVIIANKNFSKASAIHKWKKTPAREGNGLWKKRGVFRMNLLHSKYFWGGRTGSFRLEIRAQEDVVHWGTQDLHCSLHTYKPQETEGNCVFVFFLLFPNSEYKSAFRTNSALNVLL